VTYSRKFNVVRGDGSPDKPIIVVNIGDLYATLDKRFPGYQLIQRSHSFDAHSRKVDIIAIRTAGGSLETVHFLYVE